MKASDVWEQTAPFFGYKVPFREAFPDIEHIEVCVNEIGNRPFGLPAGEQVYNEDSFSEFINCSNPVCYNGGYRIGELIREMVARRSTERLNVRTRCQGYRGSPKGRKNYGLCRNEFTINVRIKYRQ